MILVLIFAVAVQIFLIFEAGWIAEEKGYDATTWRIMCFFLSFIAFVILAAKPDKALRDKVESLIPAKKEENKPAQSIYAQSVLATEQHVMKPITVSTWKSYKEVGKYPQNEKDDCTPLEWIMLTRNGNKALLLSRYALDVQPFDATSQYSTWKDSSIRAWLNGQFLNKAFNEQERQAIVESVVDNSAAQCFTQWASNEENTTDCVFLLSYAEAKQYVEASTTGSNQQARVAPTTFALNKGARVSNESATDEGKVSCAWWLRSAGKDQRFATCVSADGAVLSQYANSNSVGVRPAMWVDLAKLPKA